MKLLDDENLKENVIQDGIGKNKLESKKISDYERSLVRKIMGEEKDGKICDNGLVQRKDDCTDGSLCKKQVVEEARKEKDSSVNMNKEESKQMRQLTKELADIRFDCGKTEARLKRDKLGSEGKSRSFEVNMNPDSRNPLDGITQGMGKLVLESKLKNGAEHTDVGISLIAKKVEIPGKQVDFTKNLENSEISERVNRERKTVVIAAQPEKKGEENEDLAATNLISDALLSRGPNGIPKYTEDEEYNEYAQAKKYSRPLAEPATYNPHMCGGYVEIMQPELHPASFLDLKHLEGLKIPPTDYQLDRSCQQQFGMTWMNNMNLMPGQIYNFYGSKHNHSNGPILPQQRSAYPGTNNDYLLPENIASEFEGYMLHQHLMNPVSDGYCFPQPSSPEDLYANSQFSTRSCYDQVLSSPGSSPPSYVNSPFSAASILTGDCDVSAMSPSSYPNASPDSGFVADLSDEINLDLELALEVIRDDNYECEVMRDDIFIRGETALEISRPKKTLPLPELVEAFNTEIDPIGGSLLPSSGDVHPKMVGTGGSNPRAAKKSAPKPRRNSKQSRILPPVFDGETQLGVRFSPSTVNVAVHPSEVQVPLIIPDPVCNRSRQPRTIRPKPASENSAPASIVSQINHTNESLSGLPAFVPPSGALSPGQEPSVTSSSEQDQLVKAYRWVAGLVKERLLLQDDDGDTILHLTIVKEEKNLVKALLERYVREDLIDKVINLANKQHQTPLCLAVFLNQTDIVEMLIEWKADVNVQLQRKLNCGLMCYRLIHYVAKRGQKWVPTLVQLLRAKNIDLHAFDSDGCTAMHCAIRDHGETRHGSEKINSKDTIYHLAMHGADLNYQHGLSAKTPLHFAIEKKDSDLVGWFLGLATFIQSGEKRSTGGSASENLVHAILNAKPSGGITALQLALNIQMDQAERVKILELLLKYGAEVSQKSCDGKLRQELGKYPQLAPLLKNGTNASKNVR